MASNGWDAGRVFTRNVHEGEEVKNDRQKIQQDLFDFIQNFRDDNVFIYRDQLRQNLAVGDYVLNVVLQDLVSFDESLSQQLVNQPIEILPLFELAARNSARRIVAPSATGLQDIPEIQVTVRSNTNMVSIRDLGSDHISKLVCVSGIVIGASSLASKATTVLLQCRSCRHTKVVPVGGGFAGVQIPRICDREQVANSEKCPLDPFEIITDKCKFIDQQTLKVQEAPDLIPVGELPRHTVMSADRSLTNKVFPGSRVTITGIFTVYQSKGMKDNSAIAIRQPYLRVVGIEIIKSGNSFTKRVFTPEEEHEFIALSRSPNIYQKFSSSIAPSIYGNEDIKRAVSCLLFGGSKKSLPDGMRLRGDINVLLLGDPGTAKSQLLKFVEKVSPISIYTSGKGSSAAGLTASVIKDPSSREFYLEGGAMVLADGGVVCIDEFDKMRDEDRVAIHEAMEQQTISIAKAGITTILNARSSVLAAANPLFGRYDDSKAPGENIDFQTTILSRFDMIFIVKDEHNELRDQTIARHVMQVHATRAAVEVEGGELSLETMRRYITYCKERCAPRLSPEASEKLSSFFVAMRAQLWDMERDSTERSVIPITVRQLEAVVRITESLAKMTLSPVATVEHVDEAIRMFRMSTMDAVQSGQGGGTTRSDLSSEMRRVEQEIRRRLPIGSQVSVRAITNDFTNQGFSSHAVDRALYLLVRQETLQFKSQRMVIQRVGAGVQRSNKRLKSEEAIRSASADQDSEALQIQAMTLPLNGSGGGSRSRSPRMEGNGASSSTTNGNVVGMSLRSATSATAAEGGSVEDSSSQLWRYPGLRKEAPRQCLRQSHFGEEQVVRLMLQELRDRGFTDSYKLLQSESGFTLEDEPVARFRSNVLSGKWPEVEGALSSIGIDALEDVTAAQFIIKQQQFLEQLEARQLKQALLILQNELIVLTNDVTKLHRLSSLLMCPTSADLRTAAEWDGREGRSRLLVLESLQKYISPGKMVPAHRMETLFAQAMASQRASCGQHVRDVDGSLYTDHACPPTVFPKDLRTVLKGHRDEVWYVAFSPDGRYLGSASSDKTCIVWSTKDYSIVQRLEGHELEVACLAWSPDSKQIVSTSSDRTLRLWDVETGESLRVFTGHDETVTACKWLGDTGKILSGSLDRKVIIWNKKGEIVKQVTTPRVHDLVISSDCSLLLVADDQNSVHVYDLTTLTFLYTLEETAIIMSLALSSDARYCLTVLKTGGMNMWDLNSRTRVREFRGHAQGKYVIRCAFAGLDDRLVALGSEDGSLFVWSRDTGCRLAHLEGHDSRVNACAWSSKLAVLASASDDNSICIWPAYHGAPGNIQKAKSVSSQLSSASSLPLSPSLARPSLVTDAIDDDNSMISEA
ncbi:minichromosome maintenance protein 5 [Coemansia sp. IMI 209128]|nr:minichromosome maintenance protein 5 [Coemansia sp. IMI 209128]